MDKYSERCPQHPYNDILLICMSERCQCLIPLCKECCKEHVDWHNAVRLPANLETIDSIRQHCLNHVHTTKQKFEEERAILEYFSFSDTSQFITKINMKIEEIKTKLQTVIDTYCQKLEQDVKKKLEMHQYTHPREQKQLKQKLDQIILQFDLQEKNLMNYNYLKPMLQMLNEQKRHDINSIQKEIDSAVQSFVTNMFDINLNDDKLNQFKKNLQEYVQIKPVNLQEELNYYHKLHRTGKPIQIQRTTSKKEEQNKPLLSQTTYVPQSQTLSHFYSSTQSLRKKNRNIE